MAGIVRTTRGSEEGHTTDKYIFCRAGVLSASERPRRDDELYGAGLLRMIISVLSPQTISLTMMGIHLWPTAAVIGSFISWKLTMVVRVEWGTDM